MMISEWMPIMPTVLSALLLALWVTLFLLWPLRGRFAKPGLASEQLARRVYQERLQELNSDLMAERLSQAEYATLKLDLDRNLLADASASTASAPQRSLKWLAMSLVLLVPLAGLGAWVGHFMHPRLAQDVRTTQALSPAIDELLKGQTPSAQPEGYGLSDFARTLQRRIQAEPDNAEAWLSLGLAFLQAQEGRLAQQALARAVEIKPYDQDIAMTYAQASIMMQQSSMDPMARAILQRILADQPNHQGALLMMGMGSLKQGDNATALELLKQLQSLRASQNPSQSDSAADARIASLIAQAEQTAPTRVAGLYQLEISVPDEILRQLPADATLFISAREPQGMPMPIAARRVPWQGGRMTLALADEHSLSAERRLSQFEQVVLQARISTDGTATGPGWQAVAVPVRAQNAQVIRMRLSEPVGNP